MKESKKVKAADYLPADITPEILSRTSLETLGRCRLVSKEFQQITYDPNFFQNFSEKTKTVSGIFIETAYGTSEPIFLDAANHNNQSGSKASLTLSDENNVKFIILAATKCGILFCTNKKDNYYVGKPTTNQWQRIPAPSIPWFMNFAYGMVVFGSVPLRFKIVVFVPRNCCKSKFRCHIFDSESWEWKQLKHPLLLPRNCSYFSCNLTSAVSVSGKLYWRLRDKPNSDILRFDLEKESWDIFKLPRPLCNFHYCNDTLLVEYKGRLGLICSFVRRRKKCDCMELWVMEGQNTWTKAHKFCIMSLENELPDICCHQPVALLNSDLLVYSTSEISTSKVIFFKLQDCSFKAVEVGDCLGDPYIYNFQSDFELVNLRASGPEEGNSFYKGEISIK